MKDPHLGLSPLEYALAARSLHLSILINAILYPWWGFLVKSLNTSGMPPIHDPLQPRLILSAAGLLGVAVARRHAGFRRVLMARRPFSFLLIAHLLWLLHSNQLTPIYFAIFYMMIPLMAMGFVLLSMLRLLLLASLVVLAAICLVHGEVPVLGRLGLFLGTGLVASLSYLLVQQRHRALSALREAQQRLLDAHQALSTSARAMRDILDNVGTGFFLIDETLTVQPTHSRSCLQLFQVDSLAGRPLLSLLPLQRPADRDFLAMLLEQVFQDVLSVELSLGQLPTDFVVAGRTLRLQGRDLRDEEGRIRGVLFTVTDRSDLLAAQRQARRHQVLIDLLTRQEAFRVFLKEATALLDDALAALAAGDEVTARRALHTLKGNAGVFNLDDLSAHIHQVEGLPSIAAAQVEEVRQHLGAFLREHQRVLGMDLTEGQRRAYRVSAAQLRELDARVAPAPASVREAVAAWMAQVVAVPAGALLEAAAAQVTRVAERQGKQVRLHIQGGDVGVDADALGPVFSALPHLLNNAVDHGIEPPDERGDKPAEATLTLDLRRGAGALQIEVRDDGLGIDGEALARRAVTGGRLSAEAAARLSATERLSLIFLDGLSTAREVTQISGRGVGMAAVQEVVSRCGGKIQIESELGRGTCLRLLIPLPAGEGAAAISPPRP